MPFKLKITGLRWYIAGLMMLITVINYLDRSLLGIVAPVLKKDLAIDEIHYSYIIIAFQLSYLIMHPVAGRIIDRLTTRIGLSLMVVLWSLFQALSALGTGWRSFAFFRFLLGLGEAGNFPAGIKTISEWFPVKERTIATGIFNIGSGVGAMIAPPLITFIILRYNWQAAFVVTGIAGLAFALAWFLLYRPPQSHPFIRNEELEYIRQNSGQPETEAQKPVKGDWKIVLGSRNFWAVAVARFLSEPAWVFFVYWIPMYFTTERHMNLKEIALFAWMPFLAADLGALFGGFLSPFFMKLKAPFLTARKCAATVSALIMVGAVFIGKAPTPGWAIFFFSLGAFAHQSMSSTLMTLSADLFPKRTVAMAYGFTATAALTGGMLFTYVIGQMAATLGYGPLFTLIGCFDLIGVGLLWILLRPVSPSSAPWPLRDRSAD